MCPNILMEKSLLPDCYIENRVILFSVLQSLKAQERPSQRVDIQLRDRYDVFRQVLPNYPLPEKNTEDITIYVEGNDNLTVSVLVPSPADQSGEGMDLNGSYHMVTPTMSASIPRSDLKECSEEDLWMKAHNSLSTEQM